MRKESKAALQNKHQLESLDSAINQTGRPVSSGDELRAVGALSLYPSHSLFLGFIGKLSSIRKTFISPFLLPSFIIYCFFFSKRKKECAISAIELKRCGEFPTRLKDDDALFLPTTLFFHLVIA